MFENCLDLFPQIRELDLGSTEGQVHKVICSTNIYQIFQECHLNLALCLIRQTRFEDGIACLTSLLHYAPDNLRAHYLRGKAFKSINEY